MYLNYFGLAESPFSIAPDPQYLYMSERHREAMAHLSYGLSQGGCFIVLTGEVGTGKTTLCRNLLADLPDNVDVALILNPKINRRELLETVCDELKIVSSEPQSKKQLLDSINDHLLQTYAKNRHTVLIIDEAQLLSRTVLEQVRLLTNLETTKSKLLQIILIGQPELGDLLARNDLRQLSQRVTARYHLPAIGADEIQDYVNFRLSVAGCRKPLFSAQSLKHLHRLSEGIPRKINVLADHALLATYAKSQPLVDSKTVKQSAKDVFLEPASGARRKVAWLSAPWLAMGAAFVLLNVSLWWWLGGDHRQATIDVITPQKGMTSQDVQSSTVSERIEGRDTTKDQSEKSEAVPAEANSNDDVVAQPSIDLSKLAEDGALTAVAKPDGVSPGSVVISQEYLDAEVDSVIDDTVTSVNVESIPITPPAYLSTSAFGRVLEASSDRTGRVVAFRNLAAAWDANLPKSLLGPLCDELSERGVACLPVSDWASILRLNRPTIMVLTHRDVQHRVILYKVNDATANVLVGDQSYELPVSELRDRWGDNAMVFWRPTDLGSQFLQMGDQSSQLMGLREKFNDVFRTLSMPILSNTGSSFFDVELATRVSQLQRRFGITADGKIGRETYLLLNELLGDKEVPVLVERS